jgi:hypothetical protein
MKLLIMQPPYNSPCHCRWVSASYRMQHKLPPSRSSLLLPYMAVLVPQTVAAAAAAVAAALQSGKAAAVGSVLVAVHNPGKKLPGSYLCMHNDNSSDSRWQASSSSSYQLNHSNIAGMKAGRKGLSSSKQGSHNHMRQHLLVCKALVTCDLQQHCRHTRLQEPLDVLL